MLRCYGLVDLRSQVAEAQFMNSVKEADFLKTRKKIMTAMTQSERRQMTAALYALQV